MNVEGPLCALPISATGETSDIADLLQSLPIAICATDAEGRLTFYNAAAAELWGRDPVLGETRWCGAWRLLTQDGKPLAHEDSALAIALRKRVDTRWRQAIAERPDGTRVSFRAFPTLLRNGGGDVVGAFNTLIETTDKLQADHARMYLAAIVESSVDAIIGMDLGGVITTWNGAAERLFGYNAADAVGQSITMIIPSDRMAEEADILKSMGRGELIETFDTVRQRKDGSLVPVSLTVSPVRDHCGRIVGASKIARDITAQKESEERIRLLMREVNHRVKNQYAVILSMVRETKRHARSPKDFEQQVRERIMALSASHDLLVQDDWKGATVFELLFAQLKPFTHEGRVTISGPSVRVQPAVVQYLGIAFHELATNAAMYGALSSDAGHIEVAWEIGPGKDGTPHLKLKWDETGVDTVPEPSRAGLGTVMLERMAPLAMGGTGHFDVGPDRVMWRLEAPMSQIAAGPVERRSSASPENRSQP